MQEGQSLDWFVVRRCAVYDAATGNGAGSGEAPLAATIRSSMFHARQGAGQVDEAI